MTQTTVPEVFDGFTTSALCIPGVLTFGLVGGASLVGIL